MITDGIEAIRLNLLDATKVLGVLAQPHTPDYHKKLKVELKATLHAALARVEAL